MSSDFTVDFCKKTGRFIISCPVHLNGMVRSMPNRIWSKGLKAWTAPAIARNAEHICTYFKAAKISEAAMQKCAEIEQAKSSPMRRHPIPPWYKFKTKPFDHQLEATERMWNLDYGALFMEMGTGKTKAIVDTLCMQLQDGQIERILVVCPFSIRTNWVREIETHSPLPLTVEVAESKGLAGDPQVVIVGVESLSSSKKLKELCLSFVAGGKTGMVVDESHTIKNPKAERSKTVTTIGKGCLKRYILTGTPISHGPLDVYQQFEFLHPAILGIGSYYAFRNRYAVLGGFEGKQVVGYSNLDELTDIVKPYVFQCTKEQVLDLPDKVFTRRDVVMAPEQRAVYDKVKKECQVELSGGELTIDNVLAKYLALQQITSGFVSHLNDEGVRVEESVVPPAKNPKIKALLEIAEEAPGRQIIVWCKFKREIREIVQALNSSGLGKCSEFHGGLDQTLRDEHKQAFLDGKTRFFVANMQVGGTGLTLVNANLVVYFSNGFKYTDRVQSEDRCHRIGQVNKCLYIDLVCERSVDTRILKALADKQNLAQHIVHNLSSDLP